MTLISEIAACIAYVNWTDTQHNRDKIYFGALLNKYDIEDYEAEIAYQNNLGTYDGYKIASFLIYQAKILGYTSETLTTLIKETLDEAPFFTGKHLPKTWPDGSWCESYRYAYPKLYTAAKELQYQEAKWNSSLAWQEFKGVLEVAGNHGVLGINPIDNSYLAGNNRFYDENAQCLDWLVSLYEVDPTNNVGAITYAKETLWNYINNNLWSGSYYNYSTTCSGIECEGACFARLIGRLRALDNYQLTNWDRVIADLKYRFLDYDWDSPGWTYTGLKYYAVVHKPYDPIKNDQRRLENTLSAWITLHMFYQALDSTSQAHLRNLLDGATKGWELLCSSSALYDNGKFRYYSNGDYSDPATAEGTVLLFLMGIVPAIVGEETVGSLFIPLYEFHYEGETSLNEYFIFNYEARKIRIPVKAGNLKFLYGSSSVTYYFPNTGIYDITFASDWNSITNVQYIEELDEDLLYLNPSTVTLTIEVSGSGGTTDPIPGDYVHGWGEECSVLAVPDAGYRLKWWLFNGDYSGYQNPYIFDIIADSTLTAIFELSPPEPPGGWDYFKSHVINAQTGAGLNYQVGIKVYYGGGIDGTESVTGLTFGKVYCNSHCRTDFGDIRFMDNDKTTLLDCWMEEKVDESYAIFWIEIIDNLETDPVTIYIYYGNTTATYPYLSSALLQGEATFLLFDDFNDDLFDTNKWSSQGESHAESSGYLRTYPTEIYGGIRAINSTSLTAGKSTRARRRYNSADSDNDSIFCFSKVTGPSTPYEQNGAYLVARGYYDQYQFWLCNPTLYSVAGGIENDQWHIEQVFAKIGENPRYHKDDLTYTIAQNVADDTYYVWARKAYNTSGSNKWADIDWLGIRKWVYPEPTHGEWGSEQSGKKTLLESLTLSDQSDLVSFKCLFETFMFSSDLSFKMGKKLVELLKLIPYLLPSYPRIRKVIRLIYRKLSSGEYGTTETVELVQKLRQKIRIRKRGE